MTTPIKIDEQADFLEIELHGHTFTVDAFDALDELVKIDEKHKHDEKEDDSYLDDVAKLIVGKYGAPRCSKAGAGQFYNLVVARVNDAKKKNTSTPQSPAGSEASTAAAGRSPKRKRGSPRSRALTPSGS